MAFVRGVRGLMDVASLEERARNLRLEKEREIQGRMVLPDGRVVVQNRGGVIGDFTQPELSQTVDPEAYQRRVLSGQVGGVGGLPGEGTRLAPSRIERDANLARETGIRSVLTEGHTPVRAIGLSDGGYVVASRPAAAAGGGVAEQVAARIQGPSAPAAGQAAGGRREPEAASVEQMRAPTAWDRFQQEAAVNRQKTLDWSSRNPRSVLMGRNEKRAMLREEDDRMERGLVRTAEEAARDRARADALDQARLERESLERRAELGRPVEKREERFRVAGDRVIDTQTGEEVAGKPKGATGLVETRIPGVYEYTDANGKTELKDLRENVQNGRFDYMRYWAIKEKDPAAAEDYLLGRGAFAAPGAGPAAVRSFATVAEAEAAGLPSGTEVIIAGRRARID